MIKWLKSLFGFDVPDTPVIAQAPAPAPKAEAKPAATKTKKTTTKPATKKAAKVDLDSMSKKDLLAHAKANGIKANASMNKAALVTAIKNG
jgi:hypothetical protein